MPCAAGEPLPKPISLPGGQAKTIFSLTCAPLSASSASQQADASAAASRAECAPAGQQGTGHTSLEGRVQSTQDQSQLPGDADSSAGGQLVPAPPDELPEGQDSASEHADNSSSTIQAAHSSAERDLAHVPAATDASHAQHGHAEPDSSSNAGSISSKSSRSAKRRRGSRRLGPANVMRFCTTSLDRSMRSWRVPLQKFDIAWKSASVRLLPACGMQSIAPSMCPSGSLLLLMQRPSLPH